MNDQELANLLFGMDHQSIDNPNDLYVDPNALQDVVEAHNTYDDPNTPILLSSMDAYDAEYGCEYH